MNYEKHEKNGHVYYLVPEHELLRLQSLAEDDQDIQDFDKAVNEATEFFPQHILDTIFDGGNAIATFRNYRDMTQEQLSKATGLSRAYIAQIETDKKTGSIETLKKIAHVLNVDIELLI